jgi:murein DD-endopeptidase MepM/ murein hydrolase activator NlpD
VLGWQKPPRYLSDGYDSPMGTPAERDVPGSAAIYPPSVVLTLGYAVPYNLLGRQSLHTGDDLVMSRGKTLGQPLYAMASGVIVHARREGTGSWGNIIIIRHDPLIGNGQVAYSRYGHVDNMQVKAGDRVVRGQHIADIGDAFGIFRNVPHLHYDISPTRIFETQPGDWPWLDRTRIDRDYTSPKRFIAANRPAKP